MTARRGATHCVTAVIVQCTIALVALGMRPVSTAVAQHQQRPSSLRTAVWDFSQTPVGPMRVVTMVPANLGSGERLPLLVALHGLGENRRGVSRGAWGWPRDYELGASDYELRHSPLRRSAFLGFVENERFSRLRADLRVRPYRGLVVIAPFTPDVLSTDAGALSTAFGEWITSTLIPRARRELPVLASREATGIDGVSLGGLAALEVGLAHPETFGVVGALQPAVSTRIERVLGAIAPNRGRQRLRLVSSTQDVFLGSVRALHRALRARGVAHDLRVVEGPHDYVFNRGAGGIEMLLFHSRALRGLSAE